MRTGWIVAFALFPSLSFGQVYGYTDDNGVLILSNVPSDARMRLIAEGNPEPGGRIWRYTGQYEPLIVEAASQARLDASLVKAVIAVESGFNRFAKSHKGAMGLMQLMPDTCKRYGVVNPYDARQNVRAGAKHLRELLDEFQDLNLTLAAYNAGATPVRRQGRIPPYPETRDYVRKVTAIYRAGSKISITKGGSTYSIGPGGTTQVRPAPRQQPESTPTGSSPSRGQTGVPSLGNGASLAEIAAATRELSRRTLDNAASAAESPVAEAPKTADAPSYQNPIQQQAPAQSVALESSLIDGPVYYRYRDADGVVFITRHKPTHVEYEILQP